MARTSAQASLRDPRFRNVVAELAAPLRGMGKDELIGEDIRQHRSLNYWRNAALGVVTTLFTGATAFAVIALQQRQAAIAQRDEATRNHSRALAAVADAEAASGSTATAVRVALAGVPENIAKAGFVHAPEAEGALFRTLLNLRELSRMSHMEGVHSVAFSPDGQTLALALTKA